MKRTLLVIVAMLIISFCAFPLHMDKTFSYGHSSISCVEYDNSDNAIKTPEHMFVNYARHNEKVEIERKIKFVESVTINSTVVFHATPFNYNGILNETIKRDYSGEDPVNIIQPLQ